ncbi:GAF and ANTAR domain-containing protein [Candidatus Mycobacterium wuenschmannii]|uniref:GAF and ANTAR domain-containing protein n=1 Tax=Candidatus Mycobacterium wuenschmannii TaxID=3027808 RepID=A0ABY8VZ16_9MYCO|nr:GAF and ANTAR domain-containing protein [Candidatus Mycobacterium wuenschmannii]WIM88879.1 GAF and ANTAR domain-containing protein [Candidatus Mycobacterium wuenschmannii]
MSGAATDSIPTRDGREGDLASGLDGLDILDDTAFDALTVLSRALHLREADLEDTLRAVLESATTVMPAAGHAGLNLYVKGRFTPQATVGSAPPALDDLQKRTGEGPCIESSRSQVTVNIDDLQADSRWPAFSAAAISQGVHSMLCLPLWVTDEMLGSLSLYGTAPRAFRDSDRRLAELYATHAALALSAAQRTDQLRRAMASRDVIGQAKGILMERHRVTADQAFLLLKTQSQRVNRKLVEVAETVAATGVLPDA